jgi:hypothetical protein
MSADLANIAAICAWLCRSKVWSEEGRANSGEDVAGLWNPLWSEADLVEVVR